MSAPSAFKRLYRSGDQHFIEIIRHTTGALLLLAGTTIVQFVFDLLLTHTFHAHGAGIFYLSFTVISLLALVGRLGMDQAVVRFIPPYLGRNNEAAAGVHRTATRLSLLFTIPLGLLLFVFAPQVADGIFHSHHLTPFLRIFALGVPPLALNYLFSGTLRSLKHTRAALSIERLTMYGLGIISIVTLGEIYGLKGAAIGFVVAIYLSTFEGAHYIKKFFPPHKGAVAFNRKRLLIVSAPLLFVIFATQLNVQASVLLLGVFGSNREVAIFNIALKVSMLLNLVLVAINTIAATKISELYASGQKEALEKMVSKICMLGMVIALPGLLALVFFPDFWLGLFGDSFRAGSTALVILAIGQFINVATGSTNYILAMTGHERALAAAVGTALGFNVIVGLLLIPHLGVNGASIATSGTLILTNIIMIVMIRLYLKIWVLPFKVLDVWWRQLLGRTHA
jgi:O-antigen/teichoic acid export membrane protein